MASQHIPRPFLRLFRAVAVILPYSLLASACAPSEQTASLDPDVVAAVDARFQTSAIVQSDSLQVEVPGCDVAVIAERYVEVSDYRLIGVREAMEERAALVEVRVIARQEFIPAPDHATQITVGAHTDTLVFKLHADRAGLRLCDLAETGEELGLFTSSDSLTFWSPSGANSSRIAELRASERLPSRAP
jgi:hypothetical protein